MRICVAQIKPDKGDIARNVEKHKMWILEAANHQASLITFPELSLTGYEPSIAKDSAFDSNDSSLHLFQNLSDSTEMVIGVGLPLKSNGGITIGMVFFQPGEIRKPYSKQILHEDEKPYFVEGSGQLILDVESKKIAPAICYEAMQPKHVEHAKEKGAQLYLASVAKSLKGVEAAFDYFPSVASQFQVPVVMANSIGPCDNFESAGQSAAWGCDGSLKGRLGNDTEGILVFDTESEEVVAKTQ